MSGSATAERQAQDGAIVSMPETFPKTEGEFMDALGPVSEVLHDATESVLNVLWAARDQERLSPSQAGELLLRARFYREVADDIQRSAERLAKVAYEKSIYGPAD
jgi:hypothetical protein